MIASPAAVTIAVPAPRPGWFLCDAVGGPFAAMVGMRDAQGRSAITLVPRGAGAPSTRVYQVGMGDAGMSQIHYPLSQNGRPAGDLHDVQPGVLADPATAWSPTFSSVTIAGRTLDCRWLPRTLFAGLDARRSIWVTEGTGGIVYRSFDAARPGRAIVGAGLDRSSPATLTIGKGIRDRIAGATRFRFANRGYGYTILVPDHGAARVMVTRGRRVVQTEVLLGHMLHDPG
ncbi:MAG TPA: hypothetical protein VF649_09675 [Sphingomonas sp.]|jgi:hypothetical protein|uniref:hypothetical protein n=1 Tax=Sphingomonas sp. TaxID=28214 RepID=UPI002EDB52C1